MDCKLTNRSIRNGFTLIEMLVGVSLGLLILAGVGSVYIFSAKSFTSMSNYSELSGKNRHASDIVSRDIRTALNISSATTNVLVLHSRGGDITYAFDPLAQTLSRAQLGQTQVLLQAVSFLNFQLYARPTNGASYEQFPATSATNAKLVAFTWSCSRRVFAAETNSHGVEAALIELRNQ
jgi:prepilin-type N-terminal cleavage/methylation domain-containing protein